MVFRKRLCAETDAEDISLRCLTLNIKNNIQVSWPISWVRQEHTLFRMGIMLAIHIPFCEFVYEKAYKKLLYVPKITMS